MVQVLPYVPSFGDRLIEKLQGIGSKLGESLQQRFADESLVKILGAGSQPHPQGSQVQSLMNEDQTAQGSLAETDPLRLAQIHKAATRARGERAADNIVKSIQSQSKEKNKLAREARREEVEAFKLTNEYREKVLDAYEGTKGTLMKLDRMEALNKEGKLTSAAAAKISESLGIPLSVLANPQSEEFQKLSQDLMSNITKYYGNRILQVEVDNFLKTIPTLMNSPEGRDRIIKNMKLLLEPNKLAYNAYKEISKEGGKTPLNLHEKVLERLEPKLEKLSEEFKQSSQNQQDSNFVMGKDPFGKLRQIPIDMIEEFTKAGGVLQ